MSLFRSISVVLKGMYNVYQYSGCYYILQMSRQLKVNFSVPPKTCKRVMCYCSECHERKLVDPRTKRNYKLRYLPGTSNKMRKTESIPSNVSTQTQSDSWEGEDSADERPTPLALMAAIVNV